MGLTIKTTGMQLSSEVSQYLDKKLEDVKKLLDPKDTSIKLDVEVGKISAHHQSGQIFKAELNLHTSQGDYYAVAEAESIHAAIDQVKDELLHSLRTAKRKRIHVLRRGGAKVKDFLRGLRGPNYR